MKKNISINISGIIFHIEEDGYEKLSSYLDSINSYFSGYEDSKEIIEDIESRIAEIFLMKLNDVKQVINIEDVESLISTMGTTQDFQATIDIEDDFEKDTSAASGEKQSTDSTEGAENRESRRLYKDKSRRLLGGVASGIARYFKVDPIWIRILLLVVLIFPFFSFTLGSLSFLAFITYIILWIVLPGKEFEDDQKFKKLYRNPDGKVLGGVSSGLANYFGIDKIAVRILFVIGIFAGFAGPIIYIILWIITPEASSITEKLEMQGEPVTLSTIESNIKKELNEEDVNGEESTFAKVLLFPFRLIAIIIKGISRFFAPFLRFLVDTIRILCGIFLFAVGFFLIVGMIIFLVSYYGGLADAQLLHFDEFHGSANYLRGIINDSTIVFGMMTILIPSFFLAIAGISVITKKWSLKSYLAWPLLGLWLIGVVGFAIALPNNINTFDKEDSFKETSTFTVAGKTPVLKLNELYDDFNGVSLRLRGHDSDDFKLVVEYESRGQTRKEAIENAKMITYNVALNDSVFLFDSNFKKVEPGYTFRFQNAYAAFYIPYNRPFRMERDLSDILVNTLRLSGYSSYQMEGNDWIFNDQGQLACLTCVNNPPTSSRRLKSDSESKGSKRFALGNYSGQSVDYDLKNFTSIEANGLFEIEIQQGNSYSVTIKGPDRSIRKSDIYTSGSSLILDYNKGKTWFSRYKKSDKIGAVITVPQLDGIDLSGASKVYLRSFKANNMTIDLSGASYLEGELDVTDVVVDLSGASSVTLRGKALDLKADLGGASSLTADKLITDTVDIDTEGASKARVYGNVDMDLEASGASRIYYSGPGNVSKYRGGGSRIRKQ
ncbi:MAG: PspC domain-containing protein [Bacteroidota bacterium]